VRGRDRKTLRNQNQRRNKNPTNVKRDSKPTERGSTRERSCNGEANIWTGKSEKRKARTQKNSSKSAKTRSRPEGETKKERFEGKKYSGSVASHVPAGGTTRNGFHSSEKSTGEVGGRETGDAAQKRLRTNQCFFLTNDRFWKAVPAADRGEIGKKHLKEGGDGEIIKRNDALVLRGRVRGGDKGGVSLTKLARSGG